MEYLTGLLAPRDRTKTLTAWVGVEPVVRRSTRRCSVCHTSLSESPSLGFPTTRTILGTPSTFLCLMTKVALAG